MNKFEDILNNINRNELENSLESLKAMLSTPEGRKIKERIKKMDKRELMNKLNNIDASSINNTKINSAAQDPDLFNKINSFLDKE